MLRKILLTTLVFGTFAIRADSLNNAKLFVADLIALGKFSKSNEKLSTNVEAQKLVDKLSNNVNFEELAKSALGARWNSISKELKQDFMKTLKESIETILYPRAHRISAPLAEINFTKVDGKPLNVRAKTRFESEKQGEIVERELELELVYSSAQKQIVDAWIEGEQVSANLKRQFDQALQKKTVEQLLEQMKSRLNKALNPVKSSDKTNVKKPESKK